MQTEVEKKIGTHSGIFHADDVMAVTLLTNFTKEFKNGGIIRSRDKNVLETLDIIVDVGDVFDPAIHRYDHHQKGFTETFSDSFSTKLSSAGLVFKYFGKEIIKNAISYIFNDIKSIELKYYINLSEKDYGQFIEQIYQSFFEYLDGVDNGISRYPPDIKPKYKCHSNDLVGRIARLNYNDFSAVEVPVDVAFKKAMELCKEEFLCEVRYIYCDIFIGFPIVRKAIDQRFSVHDSGKIVLFEAACNWKSALAKIEEELMIQGAILFVIFKDKTEGTFRLQAVPSQPGTFELRKGIKEEYRGLRGEELSKVSGVSNCIFCHISGFIGGAKGYQEALQLAINSL